MQDQKIEIPQTLSHQSPLETILDNTRLSSFDFIFSKIINFFFNFHFGEAFKPLKNLRDILTSWMETETKTMWTSCIKQFHDPSFVSKRCHNFKRFLRFQSDFLIFFQKYPLNQYYRDHQFCHFSTAKIPSWYMAFIRKMVFQRKSNVSPINLWNKILGQLKLRVFTTENIYGTRVIYDLWTCSCTD